MLQDNVRNGNVYGDVIVTTSIVRVMQFIWWMQIKHQMAASPQTKPVTWAMRLHNHVTTYDYCSAWNQIFILPP